MFQEQNIIFYGLLLTAISLYVFSIGTDIKKLKSKGTVFLTATRGLNGAMVSVIITLLAFSAIYRSESRDIVEKNIIVISAIIAVGYWVYRAFSKQSLCENAIITPEYIYSVKNFRGYKWSSLKEEGITKLRIKVARKSLLGKDRVKEVCFILKNEQISEIEEVLNTWSERHGQKSVISSWIGYKE